MIKPIEEEIWLPTYSGKRISLTNINADEICLEDIGHHLAGECRYAGGTIKHCSVAEHCTRMSWLIHTRVLHRANDEGLNFPWVRLQQLLKKVMLHDGHEYVLKDIPRPVKLLIPGYGVLANKLQTVIEVKYGIKELPQEDQRILDDLDTFWPLVECVYAKLFKHPSALPKMNMESEDGMELARLAYEESTRDQGNWGWDRNFAKKMFLSRCEEIELRD